MPFVESCFIPFKNLQNVIEEFKFRTLRCVGVAILKNKLIHEHATQVIIHNKKTCIHKQIAFGYFNTKTN